MEKQEGCYQHSLPANRQTEAGPPWLPPLNSPQPVRWAAHQEKLPRLSCGCLLRVTWFRRSDKHPMQHVLDDLEGSPQWRHCSIVDNSRWIGVRLGSSKFNTCCVNLRQWIRLLIYIFFFFKCEGTKSVCLGGFFQLINQTFPGIRYTVHESLVISHFMFYGLSASRVFSKIQYS